MDCSVVLHISDLSWWGMVGFLFKFFGAFATAALPFLFVQFLVENYIVNR